MINIFKNKYIYLLFIFFFILYFINYLFHDNTKIIKKCYSLNFEDSTILHPRNFSQFNIKIKFNNDKKWHSHQLKNRKSYIKNNYYLNKNKNKAEIIFILPDQLECSLSAVIKPHGDLEDHHTPFNLLPSLQVKLKDGHIFGITNFLLLKPKTRVSLDSEILAANIVKEIGLLAPRTSKVNVKYNSNSESFIFQEKIVKEFIEINNYKEGEIISFDDRFNYTNKENNTILNTSQYKLVNSKWAKKNNVLKYNNNLEVLNAVRNNHIYIDGGPDDLYSTARKYNLDYMFDNFPEFSAIMTAINAGHGLSIDDRRFYYDSLGNNYHPIYYDGMSYVLFHDKINKPVIDSAIFGAKKALDNFSKINYIDFIKKLKLLGFSKTDEEVTLILDKIKNNLIEIKNIQKKSNLDKKLTVVKNNKNLNNLKYIFKDKSSSLYEVCDEAFSDCYKHKLSFDETYKLISQKLKIEEKELIYIASRKNEFLNDTWLPNIKSNFDSDKSYKFHNKNNSFILTTVGDIKVNFDDKLNELFITKNNVDSRVLLLNGKIENIKLNFIDNTNLKTNSDTFKNITGCVTLYNMELINLNLDFKNSKCEDAINIIRSKGAINNAYIDGSIADGVDIDFSEISIKNLNVKKSLDDCLDVSFGKYTIENMIAVSCIDKGISSEFSSIKIDNVKINSSNIAIASKDYSFIKIDKANLSENVYCLNAYNKKQEFSGGEIKINQINCHKGLINQDLMSQIKIEK